LSTPQQTGDAGATRALLTLDDVASHLGMSKAWVRDHATRRNPRIPVVRFGGKRGVLRFRAQDVEQYIISHLLTPKETR
jgi:predicted DNA-binding transcriptional regulator AlpA